MGKYYGKKRRHDIKPTFGLVINPESENYSDKDMDLLIGYIAKSRANWHVIKTSHPKDTVYQIRKLLQRRPVGVIACGGDRTVNLVARNLIRRTSALGIYPLGKFNNIYRSLYGEVELDLAAKHIISSKNEKIDYGLVGGRFFLGSIGLGFMPVLFETLKARNMPRFGIGWSRLASQTAAEVKSKKVTITIDEFQFDVSPTIFNVNLLPYTIGLPLTNMSINDDGLAEIIFDPETGKAVMSGFIRKISKGKYIYTDEVRMYRGKKIMVTDVKGDLFYLDGDIIRNEKQDLEIEIFPAKIRILKSMGEEE